MSETRKPLKPYKKLWAAYLPPSFDPSYDSGVLHRPEAARLPPPPVGAPSAAPALPKKKGAGGQEGGLDPAMARVCEGK